VFNMLLQVSHFLHIIYVLTLIFFAVKYHNFTTLRTLVRCPRAHHRAVWSALSGVTAYRSEPCALTLLHVSGTIQSSQKALLKHNMAAIKNDHSSMYGVCGAYCDHLWGQQLQEPTGKNQEQR
jgi:hypothetical protein